MTPSNRPKWILATAVAIAGTSIGGVAFASESGSNSVLPDALRLQDAVPVASQNFEASTAEAMFEVRSGPVVRAEDGSFTLLTGTADSTDTSDSLTTSINDSTDDDSDSVDVAVSIDTSDSISLNSF